MHSSLRPLTYGEILDGAFTLYRRHFLTVFSTALAAFVPLFLVQFWIGMQNAGASTAAFANMLVTLLGLALVTTSLVRVFSEAFTGGEPSIGDAYRHGARAWLSLFGAWVMAGVAIVIPAALILAMLGRQVFASRTGILLLIGLMIAVFVAAYTWLFAIGPAVVVERRGPGEALERSMELVRGSFWRVAATLLTGLLLTAVSAGGVNYLMQRFLLASADTPGQYFNALVASAVVEMLMNVLTTPFAVGLGVITYYDRRVRAEGYDVEAAAEGLSLA